VLRAGAPSFHAPARWLRLFIFDFFFLGTATAGLQAWRNGLRQVIGGTRHGLRASLVELEALER
jgi:hypothetical protein